ncbi:G-type lectin S-receptor-like serine/threonine-protein kinase At5g35370 [Cucurbita maxima]|uniref:Receptor-like serine/threonine-protein kinase n=1 Tax=Cucurbita maxima TaxID=3661 RepID=A0A6J1HU29_CUCMA|nr:G-type lectin S-receptor-like serine/threonine-protein kinase At5g35370 [Cucurbita maxima]
MLQNLLFPLLQIKAKHCMGFAPFLAFSLLFPFFTFLSSAPLAFHAVYPNFTASNFKFIDDSGAFLASLNNTFTASITNSKSDSSKYFFLITHVVSDTIIWSANPYNPVSISSPLTLSPAGLSLSDDDSGALVWSTPPLPSPVAAMHLLDSGNLLLLDHANVTLWQSFDVPTDTILVGQRLPVRNPLFPATTEDDDISFRLLLTDDDLLLQWNQLTFWKLSMDLKAFRHSYSPVSFLAINDSGFYLFASDGSTVVMHLSLNSNLGELFRFGRLGFDGRFKITSFVNGGFVDEFVGPSENCHLPTPCGKLGLCSSGTCSCPPSFTGDSQNKNGCVPTDSSISLASPCGNVSKANVAGELNSSFSYLRLIDGVDYFANNFMEPENHGVDLQSCKDLCSRNCSCLGIFYEDSSSSCFLIWDKIGSIMSAKRSRVGYIKTLQITPISEGKSRKRIPLVGLILIPSSAIFLVIAIGVLLLCFRRLRVLVTLQQRSESSSSMELDMTLIPGLPVRYGYDEIVTATDNFKTQIGSGGFGTVFKGTLPDESVVAVKKISSQGAQGRVNFCAEIAVIGNIHHVNLVRLKGFCVEGRQKLLVLEYMNRGSLDKALFGDGPVLEWRERLEIALGTARGLAYLHSGCDHKIIHCDVKPENILLSQSLGVKISDFGLSKLLTPEQSGRFTTLRGTRGYLAPEWLTSSAISDKTDVYSYGMVLLEIVRGKKNCSFEEKDGEYFPLVALEMHMMGGRYLELADPRLEGRVRGEEVEMLVRVGLCCVHEDPALRPTMANVVGMLEGGVAVAVANANPILESLNFLYLYGSKFSEPSNLTPQNQSALWRELVSATTTTTQPHPILGNHKSNSHLTASSHLSSHQLSGPR